MGKLLYNMDIYTTVCSLCVCFGHTGVSFDAENDRPGPGSLRVQFFLD